MVLPSHFPLLAGEGLVHFEQGRLFLVVPRGALTFLQI